MTTNLVIGILLTTFPYAFTAYFFFYRNEKVYDLRKAVLKEDMDTNMQVIFGGGYKLVDNYSKLPSYWKMIFSFKPLKKEHWL